MERKEKNVRPSQAQMKEQQMEADKHLIDELKNELLETRKDCESQIEGTSNIVQESDAWREKYRELHRKYEEQIEGTSRLVADCNAWREKYQDLFSKYKNLETRSAHGEDARLDEYKLRLELERYFSGYGKPTSR